MRRDEAVAVLSAHRKELERFGLKRLSVSRYERLYLEDIRSCCQKILRYTQGMSLDQFRNDEWAFDAVMRNLEILRKKGVARQRRAVYPQGGVCMHQPVLVRPARAEDAAAIAAIYNQGIEERIATFETELRSPEQMAAWLAERQGRYPVVVAERAGRVVAWAAASPYRPRPCYAGVAEFSVYAERAARGTGAAQAALQGLIDACEQAGFWKLVSRVFPENVRSRGLCRKLGFREVGVYRRHARLDGVWRDTVIVERLLGEAREGDDAGP